MLKGRQNRTQDAACTWIERKQGQFSIFSGFHIDFNWISLMCAPSYEFLFNLFQLEFIAFWIFLWNYIAMQKSLLPISHD